MTIVRTALLGLSLATLAACQTQEPATPTEYNEDGVPLIVEAAMNGDREEVDRLIASRTDLDAVKQDGQQATALMLAVGNGDVEMATVLLDAGANIDARDKMGDPAINWATYMGNGELVSILLERGARTDLRGHGNAHEIALRFRREPIIQLLVPDSNLAPLLSAAKSGDRAALQSALDDGAKLDVADNSGRTALHLAAEQGHVELVDVLLAAGATVDARDVIDFTPLIAASRTGKTSVVTRLIAAGADVNAVSSDHSLKMRAMHMAATSGSIDILNRLVAAGADPSPLDTMNYGPLTWALSEGQPEAALYLYERGYGPVGDMTDERVLAFAEAQGWEKLARAVGANQTAANTE